LQGFFLLAIKFKFFLLGLGAVFCEPRGPSDEFAVTVRLFLDLPPGNFIILISEDGFSISKMDLAMPAVRHPLRDYGTT
jgi:hypothetical protein